ncbi:MAG TPA: PadR family transcriptional regulator [Gemmatimonadaceae bacterium]|nr:PadR family transcriptional regulator [Gemmatimonadaceae bacterium]
MPPVELLPGTIDLLILKAVSLGPQHGYGILLRIEQISRGYLPIQQGTLYPALYRLEDRGYLATEWGTSENNRRAKFYTLTPEGRKQLRDERSSWEQVVAGITAALRATPESL